MSASVTAPATVVPQHAGYDQAAPGAYQASPGLGGPPPVTGQPGVPGGTAAPVVWMARPDGIAGCPPGLEYLSQIDQIIIKQQIDLMEMITNWEQSNRYRLLNSVGQQIYFAQEESGVCERQCCRSNRSFTMHITDNAGVEVIRAVRSFRCWKDSCWCACIDACAHLITIEAPVGQVVGYVKQRCSFLPPRYTIMDADMNEVLLIEGPCCMIPCTDIEFKIVSVKDGVTEVGRVTKQWSGLAQEMFTNADNFGVSFPMDLDAKIKAALLGAVFLIDFMYFEDRQNRNQQY